MRDALTRLELDLLLEEHVDLHDMIVPVGRRMKQPSEERVDTVFFAAGRLTPDHQRETDHLTRVNPA